MNEILYLKDEAGLIPIIAHVERYHKSENFKAFLKFLKENNILCQVNAATFLDKHYNRVLKKLFKSGVVTFVATDTHSVRRPPLLLDALNEVEKRFSKTEREKIVSNLNTLLGEITAKDEADEIKQPIYK